MGKITIRDVARRAGVGIGTVSRVLNNSSQVSDSTRQRVLAAIDELDFKPNSVARQLPRRIRPRNIGVITRPFLDYYSFAERLRGVQKALRQHATQYELMLFSTHSTRDYDDRLLSIIQTGAIDGLLIIDLALSDQQRTALQRSGIPFVGLNHFSDPDWICMGTDNVHGGYLATRHLLDLGHRRIAYVGDHFQTSDSFMTSQQRFAGYRQALTEAGLDKDDSLVKTREYGYETAQQSMAELLSLPYPPTAVFAMSDTQALGCISTIRAANLHVPEDISVIGYDDLEVSYHTHLTTVRQHLETTGKLAMEYLLHLIQSGDSIPVPEMPPVEIVVRNTTGPL